MAPLKIVSSLVLILLGVAAALMSACGAFFTVTSLGAWSHGGSGIVTIGITFFAFGGVIAIVCVKIVRGWIAEGRSPDRNASGDE